MPIDIIEVDEHTATITVPEPGDDRVAASIVPAFQGLSNRTHAAKLRLDALLTDDYVWTGDHRFDGDLKLGSGVEPEYQFLTTRKKRHSLKPVGLVGSGWTYANAPGPTWVTSTGGTMTFYLGADELPSGGTLTAVRMLVSTDVAVNLDLARVTYDTSTTATPTVGSTVSDSFTPTGTEDHILEFAALSAPIDNETSDFRLILDPASGPSCVIRWLEYEFTDPGPRNF